MIKVTSRRTASGKGDALLADDGSVHDDESRLAATLRPSDDDFDDPPRRTARPPSRASAAAKNRRVAADIEAAVDARLPGRIRDLEVRCRDGQFILAGVAASYYVKQLAQHAAMSALDSSMLGRLVNDIKVHAPR